MPDTVLLIGAFDTKGPEYHFVHQVLRSLDVSVITANIGVLGSTDLFPVDIEAEAIASAAGADLLQLRSSKDRGKAMEAMAAGAAALVPRMYAEGRFDGVLGMGGSGGTSVVTAAMRGLPIGVPKVCVSTVASGDTTPYVGMKDILLIPSIADVAGVNRITRILFTRAAAAVVGMIRASIPGGEDERPIIAASMFGNTTDCVDACRRRLSSLGYEVLVFHATGTGGRTMESLIDEGFVDACLDITTTEWADELCGGVFSAGTDRLSAAGRRGIPHLIVPGCVDMANFGPLETVPAHYRNGTRKLHQWNPAVTLMRTSVEENRRLGEIFAEKANAAAGPVAILIPRRGVSLLDGDDQPFCDREADQAMFDALRQRLRDGIPVEEVDANINDPVFAERAVDMMLQLIAQQKRGTD